MKVFAPLNVSLPEPSFVSVPLVVAIGSATVTSPPPPKVRFAAVPVMALPAATSKVRLPASALMRTPLEPRATAVERLFAPLRLRSAPSELVPVPFRVTALAMLRPPCTCNPAPAVTAALPVPSAVLF